MPNIILNVPDGYQIGEVAELFIRQAKGKCEAIIKCMAQQIVSNDADKVVNSVLNIVNQGNQTLAQARKVANSVNKNLKEINTITKNISNSVDSIYKTVSAVQNLQFLNIGLSAANLAVSVASFVIINQKLDEIKDTVNNVLNIVMQIKDIEQNKKIKEYNKLVHDFNSICDRLMDNELVSLTELDETVSNMRLFMDDLKNNILKNTLNIEDMLCLIHGLLPAYTTLFNRLIIQSFLQKGKNIENTPNVVTYKQLYYDLLDDFIVNQLFDDSFIVHDLSGEDSLDIITTHKLIVLNHYTIVADQFEAINKLQTVEKYKEYEQIQNEYVQKVLPQMTKEALENSDLPEQTINQLMQAVSEPAVLTA